jgi:iron-sulfur cluster repair protein YtfE (RIC family)
VTRHRALIPLSHDHHHALVEARRLRRAAESADAPAASRAFLGFFADESTRHFRDEEERLFPAVVDVEEAREPIVQALLEHQRLHALAARLRALVEDGRDPSDVMRELGVLLEAHVRHEERVLFPLIEATADPAALDRLSADAEPQRAG